MKSVDCYSVLGYIHARDRLFQMDFFRRAARGKLAELVGDAALSQDQALRTFFTSRSGQPVPEALYAHVQTDPLVAPALAAYTNGVNAFIATLRANPSQLPAAYGQLIYKINPASTDDLPDWSDVDTVAVARLFQFQLSETAEQKARLRQVGPDLVARSTRAGSPSGCGSRPSRPSSPSRCPGAAPRTRRRSSPSQGRSTRSGPLAPPWVRRRRRSARSASCGS